MASSAKEAIELDKKHPVEDVWIDEKWKENNILVNEPIRLNK